MGKSSCCGCGSDGKSVLIYACSGASDVGEIADRVARRLMADSVGKMSCLAALGAHISGYTASARGADDNLVIDGCQIKCASKLLEHADVKFTSFILTDLGLKKGGTPVDEKTISATAEEIKSRYLRRDTRREESIQMSQKDEGADTTNSSSCCG